MRSIERYLLRWILGALCLGALIMALAAYWVTLDELNEMSEADLKHVAEALGSYLHAEPGAAIDAGRPSPVRDDVADPEEIVTVLWTSAGRQLYSSDPRVAIPFMPREALTRATVGAEEWFVYTDVSQNGVTQAAQRVHARQVIAAEAASVILPATLGVSLLITVLLVFALRRGLQPLDEAAHDIAARTARAPTPLGTTEVPGELMPLVNAINGLMSRLSEALANQRRFLGDAAHELRTPVTALRLQLQLLQRSTNADDRREALQELQHGIDRSQRLVEKLLQMARADPAAEERSLQPIDLGGLVRDVVGQLSRKADQWGIDLGANAAPGLVVQGDRQDLDVLLGNLIENALRYTPAGGVIDVEACALDGRPTLRVIDSGPGIASDERERVFDRFYRGPDAQQLAREPGGSGLGLAIVRGIAERHHAVVSLHTPQSGQGLEVRISFAVQRV